MDPPKASLSADHQLVEAEPTNMPIPSMREYPTKSAPISQRIHLTACGTADIPFASRLIMIQQISLKMSLAYSFCSTLSPSA